MNTHPKKVSELTKITSATPDDLLLIIDDPDGTPATRTITVNNFFNNSSAAVRFTNTATFSGNVVVGNTSVNTSINSSSITVTNITVSANAGILNLNVTNTATIANLSVTTGTITAAALTTANVGTLNVVGNTQLANLVSGNTEISKLTVTGNTSLGNTTVTDLTITGNTTLQNVSLGNTVVSQITVSGNTSTGNLAVSGDATIGNLTVTGNTTLANASIGNTSISRLSVSGNVAISNVVSITGAVTLANTLNVTGGTTLSNVGASALTVSGNTQLSNLVSGNTEITRLTVSGNVAISNVLSVVGNVSLSNTVSVVGSVSLSNTLSATGNVSLSNTLSVTGNTILSNTLAVTGGVTLSNTLNVTGASTLGNVSAAYFSASANTTLGNTSVTNFTASSNASFANVTATFITGSANASFGNLASSGNTSLTSLTVSGNTSITKLFANGTLASNGYLLTSAGTGANAYWLDQTILIGNRLNAKEFGAVGDGVTDDTSALQSFANACLTQSKPGFIPRGIYKISNTVVFTGFQQYQHTEIYGEGRGGYRPTFFANSSPPTRGVGHQTIIWATHTNGPAVMFQYDRNSIFESIAIIGSNLAPALNQVADYTSANYCTAEREKYLTANSVTVRDHRFSPYCGIAVDGTAGSGNTPFSSSVSGIANSTIFNGTSNVDAVSDFITINNHSFETTDILTYRNPEVTPVGGLTPDTTYYVVRRSTNTFALATSRSNALANSVIDLTAAPSGTHVFEYDFRYPQLTSLYKTNGEAFTGGSHGTRFKNIYIGQFAVGICVQPHPQTQNGDLTSFEDCHIEYCESGISFGQSQSRECVLQKANISYCRWAYNGLDYGRSQSCAPVFMNTQIGVVFGAFKCYQSAAKGLIVVDCDIESFKTIAMFNQTASARAPTQFYGGRISAGWSGPQSKISPYIMETSMNTAFNGVYFSDMDGNRVLNFIGGSPVSFNDCIFTFTGVDSRNYQYFIGNLYNRQQGIHINRCSLTCGNSQTFPITATGDGRGYLDDNGSYQNTLGPSVSGRLLLTPNQRTIRDLGNNVTYNVVSASTDTLFQTSAANSVGTWNTANAANATVTFSSVSEVKHYMVNDMLYWKLIPSETYFNGNGVRFAGQAGVSYTTVALKVRSIAGNSSPDFNTTGTADIVCNLMWSPEFYDQSYQRIKDIQTVEWGVSPRLGNANTSNVPLTGDIQGNTWITNISNGSVIKVGDILRTDRGYHANCNTTNVTRVVSSNSTVIVTTDGGTVAGNTASVANVALFAARLIPSYIQTSTRRITAATDVVQNADTVLLYEGTTNTTITIPPAQQYCVLGRELVIKNTTNNYVFSSNNDIAPVGSSVVGNVVCYPSSGNSYGSYTKIKAGINASNVAIWYVIEQTPFKGVVSTFNTSPYVVLDTDTAIIANTTANSIVVFPSAASNPGREIMFKTIQNAAANSNIANIKPIGSDTAANSIVTNTAGRWAQLKADGAANAWVIMMNN